MDEDGGVLGRLPRSRPGTRSEKREGRAERDAGGAAGGSRRKPARAAQPKPARAAQPKAARAEPAHAPGDGAKTTGTARSEPRAAEPVGDVVRTAGQVAGAGFRVAGTLAQELLRRLPRR